MRINTGKYKGRKVSLPKGIRPTQDKVRKALFDILGDIEDLSFLELFAGSGSVGIEALSRAVKEAVFVESNPVCVKELKKNLACLLTTNCCVLSLDVSRAIEQLVKDKRKFDIIFLDPPYYKDLAKKALQTLGACDILAPNGFVIAQHFKKDLLPESAGSLTCFRQAGYGDTVLSFYNLNPR